MRDLSVRLGDQRQRDYQYETDTQNNTSHGEPLCTQKWRKYQDARKCFSTFTVNIIDDGTIAGGFGTSPFDGECLPTRRTVVIENGMLRSQLLSTYTAKKLGLKTTGNASRGLAGTPGIGPGNYFLQPGSKMAKQKKGLYVTEFVRQGVNLVTGDYSRGASGMWISGREFAYPVEEITVAGNLKELFFNISEIANNLECRGSVAAPTIRVDGLTMGGE